MCVHASLLTRPYASLRELISLSREWTRGKTRRLINHSAYAKRYRGEIALRGRGPLPPPCPVSLVKTGRFADRTNAPRRSAREREKGAKGVPWPKTGFQRWLGFSQRTTNRNSRLAPSPLCTFMRLRIKNGAPTSANAPLSLVRPRECNSGGNKKERKRIVHTLFDDVLLKNMRSPSDLRR